MGAPFPPQGWGLLVLDGIAVVWQVAGKGSPSCPLSPHRGQVCLVGSGQCCSGLSLSPCLSLSLGFLDTPQVGYLVIIPIFQHIQVE